MARAPLNLIRSALSYMYTVEFVMAHAIHHVPMKITGTRPDFVIQNTGAKR